MSDRAPIVGEPGYSHSHYWNARAPRCGLGTAMGACRLPQEPAMPWCNPHLSQFLAAMGLKGYSLDQARAYFTSLGWDARAVATVCARYERVLSAKEPGSAPEPERAVETNVVAPVAPPARKPRAL